MNRFFSTLSRAFAAILVMVIALGAAGQSARAQNYLFAVPEMDLEVFLEKDASARLEYKIVFENSERARPIDIVDIGLPHRGYRLKDMDASIGERPLHTFRKSEYVPIGVEVPLGSSRIAPGRTGDFKFECRMPEMVYRDTTDKSYASFQIKPTWFDEDFQIGSTRLRIAVHLPPGVTAEEVKFQSEKLRYHDLVTTGEGADQHVVARWEFNSVKLGPHNPKVAVSFPARVMDRVIVMGKFELLVRWFSERTKLQIASGVLLFLSLAFLFFRFSGGTGKMLFVLLAGGLIVLMVNSPAGHLIAWPSMCGLIALNEWARSLRAKRYLPAMATIEGGGIKRGLTAPQAGVLLEYPFSRVMTLVVFGLLKKGVAEIVQNEPVRLKIKPQFKFPRKRRIKAAGELGVVLHDYEHPFIDLLLSGKEPVENIDFSRPLGRMIKATAGLMKGFDLEDTREYYRRIVARAWTEVAGIGEIKQRNATVDKNIDWLFLEPDADERFERWDSGGYHYWPRWGHISSDAGVPGASPSPTSETSLSEVASSFAGWTENTSGQLAASVDPGSLGFDLPSSSLVDLSGVDHVTSDIFEGLSEGGGGGGGGGGCACACAGCACACACAGGGR